MLMSKNVTERNVSDCKYVEIFTHCVCSIGASTEGQCLLEGQTPYNEKSLALRITIIIINALILHAISRAA
jgi:hypothetical protein